MSSEKKQRDIIDEFIKKVDDPVYGWKPLSGWNIIRLGIINLLFFGLSLFYIGILLYAVWFLSPLITKPENWLPIVITLTVLILQLGTFTKEMRELVKKEEIKRETINWNYKRIKKRVKSEHWLLLKALIRMRTSQRDFKLSEVRRKYPSLFNEENLVGSMLYGLSPLPLPVDISEKSL